MSYSEQEELISIKIKESINRLSPDQGGEIRFAQYKFVYSLPLKDLGDKELKNLEGKTKAKYDEKTFVSKSYVNFFISLGREAATENIIEIIHVADNLWITSLNFLFDDMAIYIGHQLKEHFNLNLDLRNPEKT